LLAPVFYVTIRRLAGDKLVLPGGTGTDRNSTHTL